MKSFHDRFGGQFRTPWEILNFYLDELLQTGQMNPAIAPGSRRFARQVLPAPSSGVKGQATRDGATLSRNRQRCQGFDANFRELPQRDAKAQRLGTAGMQLSSPRPRQNYNLQQALGFAAIRIGRGHATRRN